MVPQVVAIDLDAAVLGRATARQHGVRSVCDDGMARDFGRTFDVVASVATIHLLPDIRAAQRRLADLTPPGGVLVVVVGRAADDSRGSHVLSRGRSARDENGG
ncbi:class I SAM-dependent methyltransferase [Microbacterium hominis]|uniref:class I SAM-dependent methyltransferase n=1 Tax=Microbacterium hominis TaxID=162426 RepID=UPI0037CAD8B4